LKGESLDKETSWIKRRPKGVIVIALFLIITGISGTWSTLFGAINTPPSFERLYWAILSFSHMPYFFVNFIISLFSFVLGILAGIVLLKLIEWGRKLTIVTVWIQVLSSAVYVIYLLYTLSPEPFGFDLIFVTFVTYMYTLVFIGIALIITLYLRKSEIKAVFR